MRKSHRKDNRLAFRRSNPSIGARAREVSVSFAVRNPDIFNLHGVIEEPPAFALLSVEPVDSAAFVTEDLLQISNGKGLGRGNARFIGETPDRVYVVVLGERFQ